MLNVEAVRLEFPALSITDDGCERVYLDNPAGTQVPQRVVEMMSHYLIRCNANSGGDFVTSRDSDALKWKARTAMADFLNAPDPHEIIFGPNMTTLTYSLSRAIGRLLRPGDRIIVTRMDHDANVYPWMQLAEDLGVTVTHLPFNRDTYQFDFDELDELLDEDVKLVAVGYASNAIGTINDVARICQLAHDVGAWTFVDAVQSAPHIPVDVQQIGCDFLVCSAYKFFGPHQGILWGKKSILEHLKSYQVRPAQGKLPGKFETGTQSHEGMAGVLGALEYLAEIGEKYGQAFDTQSEHFAGLKKNLRLGMLAIQEYEQHLTRQLIEGLQAIPGITIHGISDTAALDKRVPTVSFTKAGVAPDAIAKTLAQHNIFVWSGHFYAVEVVDYLGLAESGGMVRVGIAHYNTEAEIAALLRVVEQC